MTKVDSSGFASSSPRNPGEIVHPVVVQASLLASKKPPSFDEMWEPPTPDEWRRAVRILALQALRQIAHGVDLRLLRAIEPSVTWH